jgi:hypothetical protein
LLLLILLGIAWFFLYNSSEPRSTGIFEVRKELNEPVFQNEGRLFFIGDDGKDTLSMLDIEIVDNQQDILQGLMFRSNLKPDQGMFFIFPKEKERIFWMKNTQLSLDIIFADSNLDIIRIARHTMPYSTEPIPSIYPARYVVEVNAGYCDTHGIQNLDDIRYDVIKK